MRGRLGSQVGRLDDDLDERCGTQRQWHCAEGESEGRRAHLARGERLPKLPEDLDLAPAKPVELGLVERPTLVTPVPGSAGQLCQKDEVPGEAAEKPSAQSATGDRRGRRGQRGRRGAPLEDDEVRRATVEPGGVVQRRQEDVLDLVLEPLRAVLSGVEPRLRVEDGVSRARTERGGEGGARRDARPRPRSARSGPREVSR